MKLFGLIKRLLRRMIESRKEKKEQQKRFYRILKAIEECTVTKK